MRDPVKIGDVEQGEACIDRTLLGGYLRHDGKLHLFLRGCKVMTMTDTLSREELEELSKKD